MLSASTEARGVVPKSSSSTARSLNGLAFVVKTGGQAPLALNEKTLEPPKRPVTSTLGMVVPGGYKPAVQASPHSGVLSATSSLSRRKRLPSLAATENVP